MIVTFGAVVISFPRQASDSAIGVNHKIRDSALTIFEVIIAEIRLQIKARMTVSDECVSWTREAVFRRIDKVRQPIGVGRGNIISSTTLWSATKNALDIGRAIWIIGLRRLRFP